MFEPAKKMTNVVWKFALPSANVNTLYYNCNASVFIPKARHIKLMPLDRHSFWLFVFVCNVI